MHHTFDNKGQEEIDDKEVAEQQPCDEKRGCLPIGIWRRTDVLRRNVYTVVPAGIFLWSHCIHSMLAESLSAMMKRHTADLKSANAKLT